MFARLVESHRLASFFALLQHDGPLLFLPNDELTRDKEAGPVRH